MNIPAEITAAAAELTELEVHNPRYDFNDDLLPIGAAVFARIVETELPQHD